MNRHELNKRYFEWMYQLVYGERPRRSYRKLLTHLHDIQFTYTIDMDGNRADDGVNLRYTFGCENDISQAEIAAYIDNRPCSVLEMLIALSLRCEVHIMDNPEMGNRVGKWFQGMISCLGLNSMYDAKYDKKYTDIAVKRFLDRKYKHDGEGGLFLVPDCPHDMRTTEIWYQMMWYLDYILKGEE